jgi:hypothetical protein
MWLVEQHAMGAARRLERGIPRLAARARRRLEMARMLAVEIPARFNRETINRFSRNNWQNKFNADNNL